MNLRDKRQRDELHSDNEALRAYLLDLGSKILEAAAEPTDPALHHKDFVAEINRKNGMYDAAEMIRKEAEELNPVKA
jgi:hypothetical protein